MRCLMIMPAYAPLSTAGGGSAGDTLCGAGSAVLALVVDDGGVIVGHVMFSRMKAPFSALGLASVSVMPGRQRAGIGGMLIREGFARARSAGWDEVFLVGDPEYYRRFGFVAETAAGFASPYAGPYFMALALGNPGIPVERGRVAYARAFSAVRRERPNP